jgi:hypothetical protein
MHVTDGRSQGHVVHDAGDLEHEASLVVAPKMPYLLARAYKVVSLWVGATTGVTSALVLARPPSSRTRDGNGYKPAGFCYPKPVPVKNIYTH